MPYTSHTHHVRDNRRKAGMNKAVFLDRDGTINVEKHYLYKIEDFEFLPGAIEGLKMLQDAGYMLIVITNQSGIARGYYTEEDFCILNGWMTATLKKNGVVINGVYYCPHLPDAVIEKYKAVCDCRKPAMGLYKMAVKDFNIDIDYSWAVGDKMRDCSICADFGCRGFLIGNSETKKVLEQVRLGEYKKVRYAVDLLEAARFIVEDKKWS